MEKSKIKMQNLSSGGSFKFLIVIFIFSFFTFNFVWADTAESQDFVYVFHLYYDVGQLVADRDAQFKYDVLPETFVPEVLDTQFPYKGEVINLKGEVASTFQFDPKQGNPNFLKGILLVKAPYFPDGQKVNFYNAQGSQLLSISVSESSFCNDDGVCNPDVGEDTKTCPSDCKTATPVPVVSNQPSAGWGSGVLKVIIYLIIGVVIAGGWFGWKWWQKRKQSSAIEMPTNLPPNSSTQ